MEYVLLLALLIIAIYFLYNILGVIFYSNTPCLLTKNTEIDIDKVAFERRNLLRERTSRKQ